jgi:hypothetical protein
MYMALPGLVGFWPGSVTDSAGRLMDLTNNSLHLTNSSVATFGNDGLVPYVAYDGTSYHSHVDDVDLDILGTETHIEENGLTMGCWVMFDAEAGASGAGLMTKNTASNLSYALVQGARGQYTPIAYISDDGSAAVTATGSTIEQGAWGFIAMRYTPSTELKLWVNDEPVVNTTSIPASIYNGTAPLVIGRYNAANYFTGDYTIETIYDFTRPMFGV